MNKEFALPFINEETKLAKNNNPRERKKSIQNIVCCKCGFLCASNDFSKKFVKKITYEKEFANFVSENTRIMGCPIFAELPTPLVRYCSILLDPPTPPKFGHH